MARLSEYLKETRESKGMSIKEISEITKINPRYIKAIEEANYEVIGGDVYCKGFIRNYARSLGLDPEEAVRMYKEEKGEKKEETPKTEELEKLSRYEDRKKIKRAKKPVRWVIYLIALILIGVSGGLLFWQISHKQIPLQSSTVTQKEEVKPPTQKAEEKGKTEKIVATKPENTSTKQQETNTQEVKNSQEGKATQGAAVSNKKENAKQEASPPKSNQQKEEGIKEQKKKEEVTARVEEQKKAATEEKERSITLQGKVVAKTWVRVSVDGKVVFVGILNPPKEVSWTAKESIKIRVGNAGGIEWSLNGKDIGYFGKPGEVVTKEFSPKGE
ncbi:MAG: helix-turn-helix domain-containing protein [Synergistetes bacterium]|nr:helix-turn-helix domain-containing protein [Synergistota bacterium]